MRDIWTNTTWANWLQSNGVEPGQYALLELNGNRLPKKVIATAKVGEDLFDIIPTNKQWHISYWMTYSDTPVIGSLYPSAEFLESLKKKKKKK